MSDFKIDSNIVKNKRGNTKPTNKKAPSVKTKNKKFFVFAFLISLLLIGGFSWLRKSNENLSKEFMDGKILVCKDRLVSKELGYVFNKNENAFVNKRDGLFFNIIYCSSFDK